jgi:hypothetical protein
MPRTDPNVTTLAYCESHVVMKAILADGTILRLGTGTLANVPEDDSLKYSYVGKILTDSQVKISTTQAANLFSVDAENIDKQLGLTINDVNTTLHGAKVIASKVFSDPYSLDIGSFSPRLWFKGSTIRGTLPNENFSEWKDISGFQSDAEGTASFHWKAINGVHAADFDFGKFMTISGSFPLAQVFLVFKSNANKFATSGSILGSSSPPFRFAANSTEFAAPLPTSVRSNGVVLPSPYNLGDITTTKIVNIKTNDPNAIRTYFLNSQDGLRLSFSLSEIIGFSEQLSPQEEQNVEYILARNYGIQLPYTPSRTWDRKVLLVGEIASVELDEKLARIKIVSDIAPNVAFIAGRTVGTICPLVFKGTRCGYSGPLTTCNKIYVSEGGCSGRNNQHRFGGVVIEGELNRIVPGGIDTTVGDFDRFRTGGTFPNFERNREVILF